MFGRNKDAPPIKSSKWGVPVVRMRGFQEPQQDRQQAGVTDPQRRPPQQSRQQAGITDPQRFPRQMSRLEHFRDAAEGARQL